MKYTIEDLRNGKCAVKNDGTLEELRKVLKMAFPQDTCVTEGKFKYYYVHPERIGEYDLNDYTDLPKQSVKDFLGSSELAEVVKFVYHPEMTYEQKRKMYSALRKDELIEMLIEANNHLDAFAQNIQLTTTTGEPVKTWEQI